MPADDWLRRFTDMEGIEDRPPVARAAHQGAPVSSDAVRVVVDGTGLVRDVVLATDWRKTLRPAVLGQALHTAANDAITGAIDFAAEPRAATPRTDVEDAHGDTTDPVAELLVREILDLLGRFDADLAGYREQLSAATAPQRGTGMNQRVAVTFAGGLVDSVEVDVRWAERSRYTEIAAEALSALRSAQQAADRTRATVREPGSLARLRELSSDPVALCRQLGLTVGRPNP
jgi:hypothetical protein